MTTAAAANEYRTNIGPDFNMVDAFDAAYLDVEPAEVKAEDVDAMTTAQRYKLNEAMADWFNG